MLGAASQLRTAVAPNMIELTARKYDPCISIAQHGPAAEQFAREPLEPVQQRDLRRFLRIAGTASSTRSAALRKSSAVSAWRIASAGSAFRSYH
jgi:hypothetical protein